MLHLSNIVAGLPARVSKEGTVRNRLKSLGLQLLGSIAIAVLANWPSVREWIAAIISAIIVALMLGH
jgi:hypothetical protein